MIRAGKKATYIQQFNDDEYVAMGWDIDLPNLQMANKETISQLLKDTYSTASSGTIGNWASQIVRFVNQVEKGDAVCTYDSNNRVYYLGRCIARICLKECVAYVGDFFIIKTKR